MSVGAVVMVILLSIQKQLCPTKQQGDSHAPLRLQRPGEWKSQLGPRLRRAPVPPERTRARASNGATQAAAQR